MAAPARTERVWAAGFAAASQPPGARLQGKEGAEFSARGDASQVLVWARGVWHVDARNTGVDAVLRLVPRQAEAGCAHGAEASTTDAQQVSWLLAGAWLDQRGRSAGTASED